MRFIPSRIRGMIGRGSPPESGVDPRARRASAIATGLVLMTGLLPLALAPLRARYLGPVGRGEFAYFQAALSVVSAAAGGGIRHAYYGMSAVGPKRFSIWSARIWGASLGLAAVTGIPLALAASFSLPPVVPIAILVAVAGGPVYALVQIEMADSQIRTMPFRVAGLTSSPAVIEFVINIALLALRQLNVVTAIVTTLVSESVRGVVAFAQRIRDGSLTTRPIRDRVASASLAKRTWAYAPATLVPLVASNVDALVYGAFGHAGALGVYTVAKLVPTFLLLGSSVYEGPFISRVRRTGLRRTCATVLVPLLVAAVLAATVGGFLVEPLFGVRFAAARPAFWVTAIAGVAGAFYVWLVALCAARGLQRSSLQSSSAVLVTGFAGAFAVGLSPQPMPIVMGIPVALAYTVGCVVSLAGLRRGARATQ